jgi:hypothetical protein
MKAKSRQIHDSNAQGPLSRCQLTRVNSANALDEGLRIRGRGRRMNSKVGFRQTRRNLMFIETKHGLQAQSRCPLAGLTRPLFIGGQVLRNRSGSIQISLYKTDYNTISYFDNDYVSIPILGLAFMGYCPNRPQGYQHCGPWYSYPCQLHLRASTGDLCFTLQK